MRTLVSCVVLGLVTAGCPVLDCASRGGAGTRGDPLSEAAMERYTERLVAGAGPTVHVDRCAMFGGSRSGYCVVAGDPAEVRAWIGTLPITSAPAEPAYGQSCLELPAFGKAGGGGSGHEALPGVGRWDRSGPLPRPGLLDEPGLEGERGGIGQTG